MLHPPWADPEQSWTSSLYGVISTRGSAPVERGKKEEKEEVVEGVDVFLAYFWGALQSTHALSAALTDGHRAPHGRDKRGRGGSEKGARVDGGHDVDSHRGVSEVGDQSKAGRRVGSFTEWLPYLA